MERHWDAGKGALCVESTSQHGMTCGQNDAVLMDVLSHLMAIETTPFSWRKSDKSCSKPGKKTSFSINHFLLDLHFPIFPIIFKSFSIIFPMISPGPWPHRRSFVRSLGSPRSFRALTSWCAAAGLATSTRKNGVPWTKGYGPRMTKIFFCRKYIYIYNHIYIIIYIYI